MFCKPPFGNDPAKSRKQRGFGIFAQPDSPEGALSKLKPDA